MKGKNKFISYHTSAKLQLKQLQNCEFPSFVASLGFLFSHGDSYLQAFALLAKVEAFGLYKWENQLFCRHILL